jgi:predicted protein tyrosine phosphatase
MVINLIDSASAGLKNDAEVVLFNYTVETVNDCVVVRE